MRPKRRRIRRADLLPGVMLGLMLAFCLWNGRLMEARTTRWREALDAVEAPVLREDWDAAEAALAAGRSDWDAARTWLHMTARHDAADGAEELYTRCQVLIRERDRAECLADLALLRDRLAGLAEMERPAWGNIF